MVLCLGASVPHILPFTIRLKRVCQCRVFLYPPPHILAATGLLCLSLVLGLIVPTAAQAQTTVFWNGGDETVPEGNTQTVGFQPTQNIATATSLSMTVTGTATHGTDYTFGTGVTFANGTATVTIPAGTQRFSTVTFDIMALADNASDTGDTLILTIDATSAISRGNPHVKNILITEDSGVATYEIRGDPHVGEVLTLHKTSDDPDGGVTSEQIQWELVREGRSSVFFNTGSASYTVANVRVGFPIRARIVYTDGNGNSHDVYTNTLGPLTRSAPPRVVAITRQGASPTDADSLTWRVRFNELVKDVDATDFSLSGSTAVLSVSPVAGDANAWDVTARGGNLAHFNGRVTLGFASGQDIKDADDVGLRDTNPTGTNEPTYEVANGSVTVPTTSLALTELGSPADVAKTYTLVLGTDPGADVTVTVSNGDTTAVAVDTDAGTSGDQNTLLFTHGPSGTWNTAQTVTVRALNDADAEDETFELTHAATAGGGSYDGITIDPVVLTITDAGHGVVVSETSLSVVENDQSATYTLVLKSQPSGPVVISATLGTTGTATNTLALKSRPSSDVMIAATSGATGTATVSPDTLTFTGATWNTPQTVTITGKGAGSTAIRHAITSSADGGNYPLSMEIPAVDVAVAVDVTVGDQPLLLPEAATAGLTRFGRTVGQQAVDAVRGRIGADRTHGLVARLPGPTSGADGFGLDGEEDVTRALDAEDVLTGTSLTLNTMGDDGTSLAFWGSGSVARFRGTSDGIGLEGEVRDIMLGADRSGSHHLVGLLVMGSRGDITYGRDGETGRLETSLTSLVPYGRWHARNGLAYWGAVGLGWGTLTLSPEDEDSVRSDLDWRMVSGGVDGRLSGVSLLPEAEVVWHGDVLWTRTRAEPVADVPRLGGETTRVRVGVDATWSEQSLLDGFVTPEVGLGLRYDGGDAETGFGLELRSGLRWRDPQGHLALSVAGRTLAVHDDGALKDWSVRVGVLWDPHPATKEGFSAAFGYDLGNGVDGDALLGPEAYPGRNASDGAPSWRSEVAYGVSRGGGLVGSPYGGIGGTSETIDEARVGYRIEPDTPHAENMRVDVWTDPVAENEETRAGAGLTWWW